MIIQILIRMQECTNDKREKFLLKSLSELIEKNNEKFVRK